MEEKNNIKVNTDQLPALETFKRNPETGKIDISTISLGKSKRNNDIVPDDIFNAYYRELPDKVENQSGTWRTVSTGGKIKIFGGDPEEDKEIHIAGGKALQAAIKQQRTFADVISTMLCQKASKNDIEDLELKPDADNLDVIIAAAAKQASRGNVKAMEFLRDTIGQKPSEKIDANVTALTPEDKEMLQRVQARLDNM
jgi:hypothetical protein